MYYWTIQSPVFLDDYFTLALLKPLTSPPLVSHFTEKRLRQLGENFDYIYPPTGICTAGFFVIDGLAKLPCKTSHFTNTLDSDHCLAT